METAVQIRKSINVTALATLLVALFTAFMGRELNAAMLSMAGMGLIAAARGIMLLPRRGGEGMRSCSIPEPVRCAHL
jgi:hypothetical protein